jgi:hypothetical protein
MIDVALQQLAKSVVDGEVEGGVADQGGEPRHWLAVGAKGAGFIKESGKRVLKKIGANLDRMARWPEFGPSFGEG